LLDHDEYDRWIKSAKKTLESAERDLADGDYNWSCFKSHQAAEKALKALLWGIGKPEISHSLPVILKKVFEIGYESKPDIFEYSIRLNKYYIPTRYPDVWSEGIQEEYYSEKEALEAIKYARKIIEWVEDIWKKLLKREKH